MIQGIDHVVILVSELAAAQRDYAALGFTVVPGGEHAGGRTHNALVAFADGSYLELIAFKSPPEQAASGDEGLSPLSRRWLARTVAGEGLLDFALLPTAMADDVAAARTRGLALDGPFPGGRRRPDGQEIAWETATSPTPDLPFLCGDVTPRAMRVPGGDARRHANGVQGVAGIDVLVRDVAASAGRYAALLGVPAPAPDECGSRYAFRLGTAAITLVGPGADAALRARLLSHGEGPCALYLTGAAQDLLDLSLAHGAVIHIQ